MNIYESRLIVLKEAGGVFVQVVLDEDQFKRVSDAIVTKEPDEQEDVRDGYEVVTIEVRPDWEIDADMFIGLESVYKDWDVS